ncbi:head GIN domain-containing protein [Gaetbulibacter aquiaggeris]|uniref:Head GIN domain-containing protein n=1 Tax=Gaetbulibacter aquiaggeris TaxID=1735373 RepID=A0ABW7MV50_9FLAO
MQTSIKNQTVLLIACLFLVSTSYAQWGKSIKGNGNITTVTRTTSDYDGVKCAGSFDFVLVEGTEGNITIEGEENLIEYIITEIKNGALVVKVKNDVNLKTSRNKSIKITIPFKEIENVSLAGSGDLWNDNVLASDNLDISLNGSGDIVLNINASKTKASITGSGDLTLKGTSNKLEASVTGSGDFHGYDLQVNDTDVSVTGSGDAKVVCNENLKARVTGSGDIVYKGDPKTEDTKVAGSGSIKK